MNVGSMRPSACTRGHAWCSRAALTVACVRATRQSRGVASSTTRARCDPMLGSRPAWNVSCTTGAINQLWQSRPRELPTGRPLGRAGRCRAWNASALERHLRQLPRAQQVRLGRRSDLLEGDARRQLPKRKASRADHACGRRPEPGVPMARASSPLLALGLTLAAARPLIDSPTAPWSSLPVPERWRLAVVVRERERGAAGWSEGRSRSVSLGASTTGG